MIGRLKGEVLEKDTPFLLLDVAGVGYEVQVPMTTFFQLPSPGQTALVHTHFAVSESAQQLFGFAKKRDRSLFRLLIKVNGVGPKMALGIMAIEPDEIVRCVMANDVSALTKVPGVGKKTAERLIIEMRDKLKDWQFDGQTTASASVENPPTIIANAHIGEAESALIALGYKPTEAAKAVSRVMSDEVQSTEELIRLALKAMLPAG